MGEAGPAVDPRDAKAAPASYFDVLMDWTGEDLHKVYEPVSQQFGYVFLTLLVVVVSGAIWGVLRKYRERNRQPHVPYRVVKPPASVVQAREKGEDAGKRVCAVVGATGFIGSHLVDRLVKKEDCFVYALGRRFRDSRSNASVDACIQVDMEDFDGLCSALQGVDSVFVTAGGIPNAFTSLDDIWRINRHGLESVLLAAQKSRVKNFIFLCGMKITEQPCDPQASTFLRAFYLTEELVAKADRQGGMRTCVLAPGQIIGRRSTFIEPILQGKMASFPMLEKRATFQPVEYLTEALVAAEERLAKGEGSVCGKVLPLPGQVMSFKEFFGLPSWGHPFSSAPLWMLRLLARLNTVCAKTLRWAPFGADLCPAIVSFLDVAEEEVDSEWVQGALGVGPPPPMEDYVRAMVEQFRKEQLK